MSHCHVACGIVIACSLAIASPADATAFAAVSPSTSSLKHPHQAICHFQWNSIRISAARDLKSSDVSRNAEISGTIFFDRPQALLNVGQQAIITKVKSQKTTLLDQPKRSPRAGMWMPPIRRWERQQGRGINVPLPDTVKAGSTLTVVQGYVPAVQAVKTSVRSFPLNKPTGWIHLGKRLTPLAIKFTKLQEKHGSFQFTAKVKGLSSRQFSTMIFPGQKPVYPRIGKMWLQSKSGDKFQLNVGAGGMTQNGHFTGTISEGGGFGGNQHYTTLKILVVYQVKAAKLKFTLHNVKVPRYTPARPHKK